MRRHCKVGADVGTSAQQAGAGWILTCGKRREGAHSGARQGRAQAAATVGWVVCAVQPHSLQLEGLQLLHRGERCTEPVHVLDDTVVQTVCASSSGRAGEERGDGQGEGKRTERLGAWAHSVLVHTMFVRLRVIEQGQKVL